MNPSENHQENRHSHPRSDVPFATGYPLSYSVQVYPVMAPPPATSSTTFANSRPPPAVNRQANPAAPASSNAPIPPPSNNYPPNPSRKGLIACVLWLSAIICLSTILVAAIHDSIKYRPTNKTPEFLVDSIIVSPLNISKSQLTANWTLAIHAKNPNKYTGIRFKNFEVRILYNKTEFLSKVMVPTFDVNPKNQTVLFATPRAYLKGLSCSVPEKLAEDQRNSRVDFDVELSAQLTFYGVIVYSEVIYYPKFLCGNVKVGFPEVGHQGTMVAGPYQCS